MLNGRWQCYSFVLVCMPKSDRLCTWVWFEVKLKHCPEFSDDCVVVVATEYRITGVGYGLSFVRLQLTWGSSPL
jgi:hypothetical protein